MINKCPHCGFEPLDGKLVCPRCGHEIQENIAQKLQDIGEKNRKTNDSVAWSDFADVSLGALMSQMTQSDEKSDEKVPPKETNTEEKIAEDAPITNEQDPPKTAVAADDVFAENPILAAYIRQHREGDVGDGPTLEELVAASQENT
ncbi:MAG TPA: TFIIB-type zinc ribbon-containing protein, partial [Candidatus Enterococcus stercoravium]|nr:TFIIB-type zinc ribbon-containing protein [Candidatus Enterococcus stercoravium]